MSRKSLKLIRNPFGATLAVAPISFFSQRLIVQTLTASEMESLSSISNRRRKKQSIAARALLKLIISKKLRMKPHQFVLQKKSNGSLKISFEKFNKEHSLKEKLTGISVSLAHATSSVCACFSRGPIGIDLEGPRRIQNEGAFRRRICKSEGEMNSGLTTLELWVIKEAVVKANGTGLVSNVEISVGGRAKLRKKAFKWVLHRFRDGSRLSLAKFC